MGTVKQMALRANMEVDTVMLKLAVCILIAQLATVMPKRLSAVVHKLRAEISLQKFRSMDDARPPIVLDRGPVRGRLVQ